MAHGPQHRRSNAGAAYYCDDCNAPHGGAHGAYRAPDVGAHGSDLNGAVLAWRRHTHPGRACDGTIFIVREDSRTFGVVPIPRERECIGWGDVARDTAHDPTVRTRTLPDPWDGVRVSNAARMDLNAVARRDNTVRLRAAMLRARAAVHAPGFAPSHDCPTERADVGVTRTNTVRGAFRSVPLSAGARAALARSNVFPTTPEQRARWARERADVMHGVRARIAARDALACASE